jgi:hypothetical protein
MSRETTSMIPWAVLSRAMGMNEDGKSTVAGGARSGRMVARIRYNGQTELRLRGPATGRQYVFSAEAPLQDVAVRDVDVMLRSRWFARA